MDQLLVISEHALASKPVVRDRGTLSSTSERPASNLFGVEQYPGLINKAAALKHSIVRFHPLVDGNKRLGWLATYTFLFINDVEVIADNDQAFEFTMAVARGDLPEVEHVAKVLGSLVRIR